jgi:uncharacterized membrane protein
LKTGSLNSTLRLVAIGLAVVGLIDAIYLSYVKIAHSEVFCGGSRACDTVNTSPYSEFGGIPIAYLGLAAYLAILLLLVMERYGGFWKQYSPVIVFGMTLAGSLYSLYLTYIEIAVLRAICPYCVVNAIVMLSLFVTSLIRLFGDTSS